MPETEFTMLDRPASAKVTLADVAREANVSIMTVSRVVNDRPGVGDATRHLVQATIERLGYRPNIIAQGLKHKRSRTIGLIVPDVTNPYFPEIVRGAEDVAIRRDYTVLLTNVIEDTNREVKALEAFEDRQVDGVIACSPRLESDVLDALLARHPAAVVVNRRSRPDVAGSVRIDHERGLNLLADHLLRIGRSRFAFLSGPSHSEAGEDRRRALRNALRDANLDLAPSADVPCAPSVAGGVHATQELLRNHVSFDALVCFNDLVAAGAMRALKADGIRVPGDVAVVGYDNIVFSSMFTPSLTTIDAPTYDLGRRASTMLFDRMQGKGWGVDIVLQPRLVVRESTLGTDAGEEGSASDRAGS